MNATQHNDEEQDANDRLRASLIASHGKQMTRQLAPVDEEDKKHKEMVKRFSKGAGREPKTKMGQSIPKR